MNGHVKVRDIKLDVVEDTGDLVGWDGMGQNEAEWGGVGGVGWDRRGEMDLAGLGGMG